jgi:aldehyde:ferredoxin oxidoreductase
MIHFNRAGFNSPYAANSFMMYNEDPKILAESKVAEPGCLITDVLGLMSFKDLGVDAVKVIEKVQRLGLEPTAASFIIGKKNLSEALTEAEKLAEGGKDLASLGLPNFYGVSPSPVSSPEAGLMQAVGIFSPAIPQTPLISSWEDFGVGSSPVERAEWWLKRQAISYIAGICPLHSIMSPKLSSEKMAEFISLSLGIELSSSDLEEIAKKVISETIKAGRKEGEVHSSLKTPEFESNLKELEARLA